MNKVISKTLLTLVLVIFVSIIGTKGVDATVFYTNYHGIEMTSSEYNTLINLGFTEEEIYYMTKDVYEENKDLDATLLGSEIKYLKTIYPAYGLPYTIEVTEMEYNNQGNNMILGTVTTAYKTMISSISAVGNKYRYKVTVTWNIMPSNRSYDIIGVGYNNSNIYINSSIGFNYYYYNSNGSVTNSTSYNNEKSLSTGGAKVYHLPSGNIVGLGASLYYDVSKNTSNTITNLSICGDYAHATSTIYPSEVSHYTIHYGGIDLDSDIIGRYDSIPCAYTSVNVNW